MQIFLFLIKNRLFIGFLNRYVVFRLSVRVEDIITSKEAILFQLCNN